MHILFLTDNFPPEVNAPAGRTFEHCREWVRAGHRVTVITCFPNFPDGKVFKGYRNQLCKMETMDGIRVIRVWSYIAANKGFLKRTLDYASFMFSAIAASFLVNKPDLVIGTSPQFFTACAAYIAGRVRHIPFVFELRDLWPESIKAVGAMRQSILIGMLEKLEFFLYRKASRIICVTRSFKENLIKRGIGGGKIGVITNGVDMSRFRPGPKDRELERKYGLQGKFVAGYVGTHGMAHGLETILQAAGQIKNFDDSDAFRFILLGNGAKKQDLIELARAMSLDNLIFIDSVPKDQVVRYWSLLDASIIHLKKTDLFTSVIPSKLFECMATGIPILHGVAGESAEIVRKENIGLVFEPENADQLCRRLIELRSNKALYDSLRAKCIKAAKNYDRSDLASRMLAILEELHDSTKLSGVEMKQRALAPEIKS
ncbi:MAG: glycosyltransferase family 4 protein [Syntrophobacteraceae bacterium]|jgi:glycosyltransferase involved in cell wall biosynthesis